MTDTRWPVARITLLLGLLAFTLVATLWSPSGPLERTGELSEFQKTGIGVITEMNTLVVSLALAVIGGVSAVSFSKSDTWGPFTRVERSLLVLSLLLASASIYWGYAGLFRMAEMLSEDTFVADSPQIDHTQWAQYYCFAGSVLCLGFLAAGRLDGRDNP